MINTILLVGEQTIINNKNDKRVGVLGQIYDRIHMYTKENKERKQGVGFYALNKKSQIQRVSWA